MHVIMLMEHQVPVAKKKLEKYLKPEKVDLSRIKNENFFLIFPKVISKVGKSHEFDLYQMKQ